MESEDTLCYKSDDMHIVYVARPISSQIRGRVWQKPIHMKPNSVLYLPLNQIHCG